MSNGWLLATSCRYVLSCHNKQFYGTVIFLLDTGPTSSSLHSNMHPLSHTCPRSPLPLPLPPPLPLLHAPKLHTVQRGNKKQNWGEKIYTTDQKTKLGM